MKLLLLGRGKTGSLVGDVARERGHAVTVYGRAEATAPNALSREALASYDAVVDFTSPEAVMGNVEACARSGKPTVIGTTGWYGAMDGVRKMVEQNKVAAVWGSNFSVGVNLFYAMLRSAAAAATYGYEFHISETHHVHKKDAPSGTAVAIRNVLTSAAGASGTAPAIEITSHRRGEVMGRHEVTLSSPVDTITLVHDAKSRRGFAEGAVLAAEWVVAQRHPGLYDFSDIFPQL